MQEFITVKRWLLKDGRGESELLAIVQNEIIPTYRKLSSAVRLGLLHIAGTRSYLATQHWQNHATYEATVAADSYQAWFKAYEPTLERWGKLMVFEEEWVMDRATDSGEYTHRLPVKTLL